MTNKMIFNANKLIQKRIIEMDMEKIRTTLESFATREDNKNLVWSKKKFPDKQAFKKIVNRLTIPPKKVDSKAWKLQITENSLVLIYALAILDISPKEFIEKISEGNFTISDDGISPEYKMILNEIRKIPDMLNKNTDNERHSLDKCLKYFVDMYNILNPSFGNQNPYCVLNTEVQKFLVLQWKQLRHYIVRKYLRAKLKSSIDFMMESIIPLYELCRSQSGRVLQMDEIERNELNSQREELYKSGSFSCLNLCFAYELVLFTTDIVKKSWNEAVRRSEKGKFPSMGVRAEKEVGNVSENKLLALDFLKNNQKLLEDIIILYSETDSKMYMDDENKKGEVVNDIFTLTLKIFVLEFNLMSNFVLQILSIRQNNAEPDTSSVSWVLTAPTDMLCKNLEPDTDGELSSVFNELRNKITSLKGAPQFVKPLAIQRDAMNFVKQAWKTGITPVIATGMGSGKTRVACESIFYLLSHNPYDKGYVLVVTPFVIIEEWKKEMKKCNMGRPVEIIGNNKVDILRDGFDELTVYITSYESVESGIPYYMKNPPLLIIYDELHEINNSEIMQSKFFALAKLNTKVNYKMALTGTPTQNSVKEFGMNYYFFNEQNKYLPSEKKNEANDACTDNKQKESIPESELSIEESLKILIGKTDDLQYKMLHKQMYFYGKDKHSALDISCKIIPVAMYDEHFAGTKMMKEYENYKTADINQYALSPCSSKISNPEINTIFDSSKLEFVAAIFRELPRDEKIIVFSFYKKPLYRLREIFQEDSVLEIGNVDKSKDEGTKMGSYHYDDSIEDFYKDNDKNGKRILLTTIKKSGTGRNLDVANNLILLEAWWNPMVVSQTLHRIVRNTQKRKVNIYMPVFFVKNSAGKYEGFELEKELWRTMVRKVHRQNKFWDGFMEKTKKQGLPDVKNLVFGEKSLPSDVVDAVLVFERNDFSKCEIGERSIKDFIESEKTIEKPVGLLYKKTLDENCTHIIHIKSPLLQAQQKVEESRRQRTTMDYAEVALNSIKAVTGASSNFLGEEIKSFNENKKETQTEQETKYIQDDKIEAAIQQMVKNISEEAKETMMRENNLSDNNHPLIPLDSYTNSENEGLKTKKDVPKKTQGLTNHIPKPPQEPPSGHQE